MFKIHTIHLSGLRWSLLAITLLLWGCAGQPPAPRTQQQAPDPEKAVVQSQEGMAAYHQGDIPAAIDAWKRAVELNPLDAVTHNNLALLLKQQGKFKEAADMLQTGLENSPDTAELHYNLAVISELYLLDLSKALRHYQRYQSISAGADEKVTGWIADLERRLD